MSTSKVESPAKASREVNAKMNSKAIARYEKELKAIKAPEGTKFPKYFLKIVETIALLETKKAEVGLTTFEMQRLVNAREKAKMKNASALYRYISAQREAFIELGSGAVDMDLIELLMNEKGELIAMPTFKKYRNALPKNKAIFGYWDMLSVTRKLNTANALKDKALRQQIKENQK